MPRKNPLTLALIAVVFPVAVACSGDDEPSTGEEAAGGNTGAGTSGAGGASAGSSGGKATAGGAGSTTGGSAGAAGAGTGGKASGGAGAGGSGTAGKGGTSSAGSGGAASAGSGGTASAGAGGASSAGSGGTASTTGCGKPTTEATKTWLPKTVTVAGKTRELFVYLPGGYDPQKPYPVFYQFHGCSSSANKETNNVPVEKQSGDQAIHVRGRAVGDCWDNSKSGPDVLFFDEMVKSVETSYCADATRRFATGYSSGSFMTHVLACVRGDKLRGVASIAGGQAGSMCSGKVAALLIHDADDKTVDISASIGTRDALLKANTCGSTTQPFDPAPCQAYEGCAAGLPVVWCQTAGKNHDRQDALSAPAFWKFLSAL